jgi:hypothetical protein
VALAIITARSAIIDIPRGSLASDVARGCRPVFLNTLFPSRFPPAAAAAVATHTPCVSILLMLCCCACRLARKRVEPAWKGAHGGVITLCVGRTASSGGELSLAPVVIYVEAMGLVLQFNSKMASNGCTAAYATNFSRTATFEIPRGDLVTLHTCVRHLVFLNILFPSRFPLAAAAAAGAHVHMFQHSYCSA